MDQNLSVASILMKAVCVVAVYTYSTYENIDATVMLAWYVHTTI
jgi:hypothetical protein